MLSFLFWNLNGNGPTDRSEAMSARLGRLARNHDIDVFVFAESTFAPDAMANVLTAAEVGNYWHSDSECKRIQIYTRLPSNAVRPRFDSVDERLTIRLIEVSSSKVVLAAIHMQSQLHHDVRDLGFLATTVHNDIASVERSENNHRTILVGDLNMNPFDDGMVAAHSLHGVMAKQIASTKERVVSGRPYRVFYNPMWGLFGDRTAGPPGTYYRPPSTPIEYHRSMFDQVLLRPELMDSLEELKILDSDG